jgi:proline iminopeptidase
MQRRAWIVLFFLVSGFIPLISGAAEAAEDAALFPDIEPFRSDALKVSGLHEIHFELCGNPEGKPVFVLHGGPGGACTPYMRRFFDPRKHLIVLHDQRGSGKSKPFGEIRENTTQDLVQDIEKLRKHLKLGKIILFGGSWGSTLALAYGETYPENVSGMVLRGVFTATKEEIDHYYNGGVRTFFPETYDKLIAVLPDPTRRPLPAYLLELIQTRDKAEEGKYSRAWARYESKIAMLEVPDEFLDKMRTTIPDADKKAYGLALMENYYMANGCFFEEGQLLKNAGKLAPIPSVLVNGRYDMICPPLAAYRLHEKLPASKLLIVESAGHWMGEKPIEQALLKAMKEFE